MNSGCEFAARVRDDLRLRVHGLFQRQGVGIVAERVMPELGLSQVQVAAHHRLPFTYAIFQVPGALIGQRSARAGPSRHRAPDRHRERADRRRAVHCGRRPHVHVARACAFAARRCTGRIVSGRLRNDPLLVPGDCVVLHGGTDGHGTLERRRDRIAPGCMAHAGLRLAGGIADDERPVPAACRDWYAFVRDRPELHPAITPAELAELNANPPYDTAAPLTAKRVFRVLGDPQILLITLSYLVMNSFSTS